MPNIIDYLEEYGDLSLSQRPVSPVDALILAELSYLDWTGFVSEEPGKTTNMQEVSQMFFELPEGAFKKRLRTERDEILLKFLGKSRRFGQCSLTGAEEIWSEESEMQFAALTVLLEDGSVFVVFRGTDGTLVGWKEDFNLSFLDTIPGQWAARDYLEKVAEQYPLRTIFVGGHSKGGNLAVFAAAKCNSLVRQRIQSVYNNDGPGFSQAVLKEDGYQEMKSRIHTFVPQSSVVGMLLEHEEPYIVIKSNQVGLLQHEPYSWEVLEGDFVRLKEVTEGSRLVDQTVKSWLSGLSKKERETFVDAVYVLLQSTDAEHLGELVQPGNIRMILQKLGQEDDKTQRMLLYTMAQLVWAAARTVQNEWVTEDEKVGL